MTSREFSPRAVPVGPLTFGDGNPFVFIAGPCVIENRDSALRHASKLRTLTDELGIPFVYKSSYDKANRSSHSSYRGLGTEEGLRILADVKAETDALLLTDVHSPQEVPAAANVVDIIQIPAFLCRQTDLLTAAGQSELPINVKKGQFLAPQDMSHVAAKVAATGNSRIILTERGVSFGYNNLISDMRALHILAESTYPVVFDATHSVQMPGGQGTTSGGQRQFIEPLARAAMAVGIDGLFMEIHEDPASALSDSATVFPLSRLRNFLLTMREIDRLIKGLSSP